jgi:hypothetical protein
MQNDYNSLGLVSIRPSRFGDYRGYFVETLGKRAGMFGKNNYGQYLDRLL